MNDWNLFNDIKNIILFYKMKIVFVTPAYRPSFHNEGKGGGEISNQILMQGLSKKKNRVLILSMLPVIQKTVYRDGHVIVVELGMVFWTNSLGIILSMFFFRTMLARFLKRITPDIVIASTSTVKVAGKVSREQGVPVGAMVRAMENLPGYGWDWSKTSIRDIVKYLSHRFSIGWPGGSEIDEVDFIISNSEFLCKKYLQSYPEKENFTVYPPLDTVRSSASLPSKIKKVMMVGTTKDKGFDIFCNVAKCFPQLEFHAIGDRSLTGGDTRVVDGVVVHGWIYDPIPFVDTMDLVLVPSICEEAFGRIAVEALCRKKFVLVSSQGGLPEAVGRQDNLIVKANDTNCWVEKINDFIENNNKYKCSTFKAIKLTRQFTIENQAEGFISYLKRIELYFK